MGLIGKYKQSLLLFGTISRGREGWSEILSCKFRYYDIL